MNNLKYVSKIHFNRYIKFIESRKKYYVKNYRYCKNNNLLKGENHPLYGKGYAEESKLKIKQNYAPRGGESNSHTKKWILEDPNDMIYSIIGTLKKFCIEHTISYGV